ncbi:MAG: sigma-54-dependent transcriptional regulator [Rickettsiales bacterium]
MKLLIVGDLKNQLIPATKIATQRGAKVSTAPDILSALHTLRNGKSFDVVMVDVEQDIKKFIDLLISEKIYATIIACGIEHNKEKAVAAIKAGAKEYIPLPPEEDLIAAIFEAISKSTDTKVVYESEAFAKVITTINKVAKSEASVLITGESGTGKEIIARLIHEKSNRANKDFIAVNCAAIPENLLESELFGHEKGAFTGAIERRIGKFEQANHGTLLLDEVSEMDLKLQAKLLRAIQEREIVRVGGNQSVRLDIRILATTNRNLLDYVKEGKFREDLFYRLNVININLPPLRERMGDVLLLSDYFIKKFSELNGVAIKELAEAAHVKLQQYRWPGNVRELENTIHRAVLLSSASVINEEDIIVTIPEEIVSSNDNMNLEEIEKAAITATIEKCYGDEVKAAAVLGISLRALRNKLKQYKEARAS